MSYYVDQLERPMMTFVPRGDTPPGVESYDVVLSDTYAEDKRRFQLYLQYTQGCVNGWALDGNLERAKALFLQALIKTCEGTAIDVSRWADASLVRVPENLTTKLGTAFCAGDYVLMLKPESHRILGFSATAWSLRNAVATGVPLHWWEPLP